MRQFRLQPSAPRGIDIPQERAVLDALQAVVETDIRNLLADSVVNDVVDNVRVHGKNSCQWSMTSVIEAHVHANC